MAIKITELLIKITIIVLVLMFVIILLIKRFIYFRPSHTFLPVQENYKDIIHGHLHGWLLENQSNNKIILYCHGNTGNMSYCDNKISSLKQLGYNVLIFDYSGFGKSSGVPSEQQLYDDASMITALVRQTYSTEQIILYGESLGATIAIYVAIRYKIPLVILESPLPSMRIIAEKILGRAKFLAFPFIEFNIENYLKGYHGKSLLIHSINDEKIPYETIVNLQNLVTLHIPVTGLHDSIIIPWNEIKRFIES